MTLFSAMRSGMLHTSSFPNVCASNSESMRPCGCRGGSKSQSGLATTLSATQHLIGTLHDNESKQFYMNTARPSLALTTILHICDCGWVRIAHRRTLHRAARDFLTPPAAVSPAPRWRHGHSRRRRPPR